MSQVQMHNNNAKTNAKLTTAGTSFSQVPRNLNQTSQSQTQNHANIVNETETKDDPIPNQDVNAKEINTPELEKDIIKFEDLEEKLNEIAEKIKNTETDEKKELIGMNAVTAIQDIMRSITKFKQSEQAENFASFFDKSFHKLETEIGKIDILKDSIEEFNKQNKEFEEELKKVLGVDDDLILRNHLNSLEIKMQKDKDNYKQEQYNIIDTISSEKIVSEYLHKEFDKSMIDVYKAFSEALKQQSRQITELRDKISSVDNEINNNENNIRINKNSINTDSTVLSLVDSNLSALERSRADALGLDNPALFLLIQAKEKAMQALYETIEEARILGLSIGDSLYDNTDRYTVGAGLTAGIAGGASYTVANGMVPAAIANSTWGAAALGSSYLVPGLNVLAVGGGLYVGGRYVLGTINAHEERKKGRREIVLESTKNMEILQNKIRELNKEKENIENSIRKLESSNNEIDNEIKKSQKKREKRKIKLDKLEKNLKLLQERNKDLSETKEKYMEEAKKSDQYIANIKKYIEELGKTDASLNEIISDVLKLDEKQKNVLKLSVQYKGLFNASKLNAKDVKGVLNLSNIINNINSVLEEKGVNTTNTDIEQKIEELDKLNVKLNEVGKSLSEYKTESKSSKILIKETQKSLTNLINDETMNDEEKAEKIFLELQTNFSNSRKLIGYMDNLKNKLQADEISQMTSIYENVKTELVGVRNNTSTYLNKTCLNAVENIKKIRKLPDSVKQEIDIIANSNFALSYRGARIFLLAYNHCFEQLKENGFFNEEEVNKYSPEELSKQIDLNKYEDVRLNAEVMARVIKNMEEITEKSKGESRVERFINLVVNKNTQFKQTVEGGLTKLNYSFNSCVDGIKNIYKNPSTISVDQDEVTEQLSEQSTSNSSYTRSNETIQPQQQSHIERLQNQSTIQNQR